jgi:hypothetical protein
MEQNRTWTSVLLKVQKMVSFYKTLSNYYLRRNYVNSKNIDMVNPKDLNNYLSIEDIALGSKALNRK